MEHRGVHPATPDLDGVEAEIEQLLAGEGIWLRLPGLVGAALALALLVGFSRVRLGVYFRGDVVAGQVIATVTAIMTLLLT
jgi:membrane-associated phospholipid phosphatase